MNRTKVVRLSCFVACMILLPALAEAQTTITIDPSSVTTEDLPTYTITGQWPDACVPQSPQAFRQGTVIFINTQTACQAVCPTVVTPFKISVQSQSQLPAGSYTVQFSVTKCGNVVSQTTQQFAVAAPSCPAITSFGESYYQAAAKTGTAGSAVNSQYASASPLVDRACGDLTPLTENAPLVAIWDSAATAPFLFELYSVGSNGVSLLKRDSTTSHSYYIGSLQAGSYKWRVRRYTPVTCGFVPPCFGGQTCSWSPFCDFQVGNSCPTIQPLPILLSDGTSRNCNDYTPIPAQTVTFRWPAVSGAAGYEWEAYSIPSPGSTNRTIFGSRQQTATSQQAVGLAAGYYAWRVRVLVSNGATFTPCLWSSFCEFQIGAACQTIQPSRTAVDDGSTRACGDLNQIPVQQGFTLKWSAANGASSYEVELDSIPASGSTQRTKVDGAQTTATQAHEPGSLFSPGFYTWRVRAINGTGTSAQACPWSDYCEFQIGSPCPAPAILTQPADQRISSGTSATLAVGAGGTNLTYQWYQVSASGTSPIAGATGSSYTTPPLTQPAQYRVRVTSACGAAVDSNVATVSVNGLVPQIVFTATPPIIRLGQSATLSFVTQNATSVLINQNIGLQPSSGTVSVSPNTTTTYTLTASGTSSVSATVTVTVLTQPLIALSSLPDALLQVAGSGGATTTFTLTNAGGGPSTVTLRPSLDFFTLSPSSFTLPPGGSQVVTVTGNAEPSGSFEGIAIISGAGVPSGLSVPVKLLSTLPPSDSVNAKPGAGRVSVAAPLGSTPSGTLTFTNSGNATLTGILVSDVPWIIPQPGTVTIPAGTTATFTFTIDRSQRPDADAPIGSVTGNISLQYFNAPTGTSARIGVQAAAPVPGVAIVSVVDTVQSPVSATSLPPLNPNEVALFVPGVGHVQGSVGLFISDVSVLNLVGNRPVTDLKFYYTPITGGSGGSKATAVSSVPANTTVALADVVSQTFGTIAQVGSLQIRTKDALQLAVSTNIFNSSNPAGTYGTAIPTFRSDRAVAPGDRLVLTGLRQDASGHTNLFIQETAGIGATVQSEFVAADGSSLGTRSDQVAPFTLSQINNVVPTGAVSAIITNAASSGGKILAYATPVDQASGDTWSVVDWGRQYDYSATEPTIIPVAGIVHGANNTLFRTDIAIMNTGATQATGTLRYNPRGGQSTSTQITLRPRQTNVVTDVVGSLLGATTDSVGFLVFTPTSGTFAVTSRTYTTTPGQPATFGTAVPALGLGKALRSGAVRMIGSLDDASRATVVSARPASFRTNFGLVETTGTDSVTVRATLRYTYPAGTKVQGLGSGTKDYTLAPGQFLLLNGIGSEILGAARDAFGDLRGVEVDFQVVSGNGSVTVFTSSIDNGSGDSILRIE